MARPWNAPRTSRLPTSGRLLPASPRSLNCGSTRTRLRRLRRSPQSARKRSSQSDELRVVLVGALELEELVVAAARAIGIIEAHARARFVHGAAALFLVEEHANRREHPVLAVAQQARFLLRVVLGEALLGVAVGQREVLRQAFDIARGHFDLGIATAVGGTFRAGIIRAYRNRERLAVLVHASERDRERAMYHLNPRGCPIRFN